MIHVTPPMGAPDVVKRSKLANEHGWCEVDKHTLRCPRFPNVFALGDAAGLPTSKTGAAVRKQAPVLVANLLAAMGGRELSASYDGYPQWTPSVDQPSACRLMLKIIAE